MSSKINLKNIVFGHFKTLVDSGRSKISFSDIFTFFIIPATLSGVGVFFSFNLSKDFISLLVNFGAIFTALLLSVLVLVYDQENKIDSIDNQALKAVKKNLLKQLYFNICYCIAASVVLVVACLFHSVIESVSSGINIFATAPLIIFVVSNLVLTILMIVKRMHVLLVS
ncbi:MAG: hypothetical protein MI864_15140 [Pseudomonadales bacterium]|nr:hypothetical protein [Pseudomonadales bacterium]